MVEKLGTLIGRHLGINFFHHDFEFIQIQVSAFILVVFLEDIVDIELRSLEKALQPFDNFLGSHIVE